MKKLLWIPLLAMLLSGCGKDKVLETVSDVQDAPVVTTMQRVMIELPPELSKPVLDSQEHGTLYLCDDYSVMLQTVGSGDLRKTIRTVTGMEKEDLEIIQTQQGNIKRYQWMWTTNGENGIQLGRGCVMDDGVYHYALTALADERVSKQVQPVWNQIFRSFQLASEQDGVSTGS